MTSEPTKRSAIDADEADALQALGWQAAADGSACPDSSLLLACEEGVLDTGDADEVRAHVKSCATCQLVAKDLASVVTEEPTDAESARIRGRLAFGRNPERKASLVWLAAGGLATAAALAGFLLVPRLVPPAPDTQLAKAAPPQMPSVFVVGRPLMPLGDVDLAVRGEAASNESLPDQITSALDIADTGDLASAVSGLEGIVSENPTSRSAGLGLGAVRLRAGRNADAVAALERARSLETEPEISDEIDWFLSIALVRTGSRERARMLLDGVCKRGGSRGASACAGVAEIDRSSSPW